MGNVMTEPLGRLVAVCDLDSNRLAAGKKMAEDFYAKRGESARRVLRTTRAELLDFRPL
jgi:hypothetical protein